MEGKEGCRRFSRQTILGSVLLACGFIAFEIGKGLSQRWTKRGAQWDVASVARDCAIFPLHKLEDRTTADDVSPRILRTVIEDDRRLTTSAILHLIQLCGSAKVLPRSDCRGRSLISILTDSTYGKDVLGESAFVRTPQGCRFPTGYNSTARGRGDETHRDQCLAVLLCEGERLSTKVSSDKWELTLRDVLADSISRFSLTQDELEWSAIAFVQVLPPTHTWRNRFGEECSFDTITRALIERWRKSNPSCEGTHVLSALTLIAMVDRACSILSNDTRRDLSGFIQTMTRLVIDSQCVEGCWGPGWRHGDRRIGYEQLDGSCRKEEYESTLLRSAHLAQWLQQASRIAVVPRSSLSRARSWLVGVTENATDVFIWSNLCPVVHAACAIRDIRADEALPR
jgi:hypothetical protein